jgi:hypothetical protein
MQLRVHKTINQTMQSIAKCHPSGRSGGRYFSVNATFKGTQESSYQKPNESPNEEKQTTPIIMR